MLMQYWPVTGGPLLFAAYWRCCSDRRFPVPGAAMLSLVLLFAAYALADGIFVIVAAVRAAKAHERWGLLVLEGLVESLRPSRR